MKQKPKVIVVLGATATGKSSLAIELAKKFNGEVISADSRQVYVGLDIGTGKVTKKEMAGVPHHMLDAVSPKKVFTVSEWRAQTEKIIGEILSRGKLPIICGGTGFYIQSIVDNILIPEVAPNKVLRVKLEKKSAEQLFAMLQKMDSARAENIDRHNPARLVRAIEIAKALGKVPAFKKQKSPYDILQIGLTLPDADLKARIHQRLLDRIKAGMVTEAKKLYANGLSWKRMHALGLEYRYLAMLLQEKIDKKEFVEKLNMEIWHYARRQWQWFKRDKKIQWYEPSESKDIIKIAEKWLHGTEK